MKLANSVSAFELNLQNGSICESDIIVLLGANGVGKTTFIRLMAGLINSDNGVSVLSETLSASYMAQNVKSIFKGTVGELLSKIITTSFEDAQFKCNVIDPMKIHGIMDKCIQELSPGDIQRVYVVVTLGRQADVYLLDEPLAHLDVEQRIATAVVIKRFICSRKKIAFIVEHDWMMASYMATRIVTFEGTPGVNCTALAPKGLVDGIDHFLRQMDITARYQTGNFFACINKPQCLEDRDQKTSGQYYFLTD
jgi:ATP-binding cassette subfamily E protein 1